MRRIGETRGRRSRTRGRVVAALLIGLGASCATAPFRGDTGIRPFAFDLWDVHCPSGLRVVVERTPGSPVVGVTALVGVGSRHDPPGLEGLAHVVEHLAFRSHQPEQATAWDRFFELGATFNGHTGLETTTYESFAPAGSLHALLVLEGQRMLEPIAGLDDATFAVELEVVRNELRLKTEADGSALGFFGVEEAVFPASHPYARPGIGTHASLSRLTLDDARRFASGHYRPEDMTLVVSGDIDLAHAEEMIRQALPPDLYGDRAHPRALALASSRNPPSGPPPAPPPAAQGLPRLTAAVRTPQIWIAWTAPGGFGNERFVAEMWAAMGQGNFSVGQFDDPDIADADLFALPHPLATIFVCRVSLTQGTHPEESLKKVMDALPWLGDDDIYLDSRIRSLKTWALRVLAFSAEDVSDRSRERAEYAHFTGSLGYYGDTIAKMQAITADQARAFATQYLSKERARALLVEPLDVRTAAGAPEPTRSRRDAPDVKHPPLSPPTMASLEAVKHLRNLRRIVLPNGMEVAIVPHPGAPVITAILGMHGGVETAVSGLEPTLSRAMQLHFDESPGDFGIGVGFGFGRDLSAAAVTAGAANLPRALDNLVFALRSYNVEWPSDKFDKTTIPYLRKLESDPLTRFDRAYKEALFKGHPYGRVPTADDIAAVKKPDIQSFLDRVYNPRNALLVVVGDLTPADVEVAVRDAFGSWKGDGGVVAAPARLPAAGGRGAGATAPPLDKDAAFQIVNRPGATQAVVHLGCLLPEGDARLQAVREAAAWSVRDRLESALRHKSGSTYNLSVRVTPYRAGGATLEVATTVDNGGLPSAIARLRLYWEKAADGVAIEANDLEAAKGALASNHLLGYEESGRLAAALLSVWNMGWPLDAPDHFAEYLASSTLGEANATLSACAQGLTVVLLGDERVIRDALATAPPAAPPREAPALPPSPDAPAAPPPAPAAPDAPPLPQAPPAGPRAPDLPKPQIPHAPPAAPAPAPVPPAPAPPAPAPPASTPAPASTTDPPASPANPRPLFREAPPAK